MLGDLNIAEPGAQIGFAGPRVIEQTIRQKLSGGIPNQRVPVAARLSGCLVKRGEVKDYIGKALDFFLLPAR